MIVIFSMHISSHIYAFKGICRGMGALVHAHNVRGPRSGSPPESRGGADPGPRRRGVPWYRLGRPRTGPAPPLLWSIAFVGGFGLWLGYDWEELFDGIANGLVMGLQALLIIFTIYGLIATWVSAGTIPGLMYYGLEILAADDVPAGRPRSSPPSSRSPSVPRGPRSAPSVSPSSASVRGSAFPPDDGRRRPLGCVRR